MRRRDGPRTSVGDTEQHGTEVPSSSDTNESKSVVEQKKPILVVEFADTPSYRAAVEHSSRVQAPTNAEERPSEPVGVVQNSNSENSNSNLLLTEEEQHQQATEQLIVRVGTVLAFAGIAFVIYKGYRWLWTLPPN